MVVSEQDRGLDRDALQELVAQLRTDLAGELTKNCSGETELGQLRRELKECKRLRGQSVSALRNLATDVYEVAEKAKAELKRLS